MGTGRMLEAALFMVAAAFFATSLAGLSGDGSANAPGPRQEDSLRVVTWNVGGVAGGGTALQDEHVEHVVQRLVELDADLVLLQELRGPAQAQVFLEGLGEGWSGRWSDSQDGATLGIFAQRGRLRRRSLGLEQGRHVSALLRREDGAELHVVALHAHARSSRERNELIGAVLDAALERAGERGLVLAGDLNLDLDLDKRRDLFSDDAYLDVESYNYVATRLHDAGLGAGSTAEPDRRLDYVFLDRARLGALGASVWKRQRVGDMDHDPLVVDLLLEP